MHNLARINGRVAMAYQGQTPWHTLGTRMPGTANVEMALHRGNLKWCVECQSLTLPDGRRVPDHKAIVRDIDQAYLGTVGAGYRPIQNAEAFAILDPVCRDHGVTIESAGALGNGARTWMLAKMGQSIEVVPGDQVNGYILITNGHDGSLAYSARLTPIRVVCQNTLQAAMSNGPKAMIALKHTANVGQRVQEAERLITRLTEALRQTGETYQQMAARHMNPEEIAAFIENVLPSPADQPLSPTLKARRETIAALVWTGKGSDLAGQTAWGAYNAVCEYWDHVRPAEAGTASAKQGATESAIFGAAELNKLQALQLARQLVYA